MTPTEIGLDGMGHKFDGSSVGLAESGSEGERGLGGRSVKSGGSRAMTSSRGRGVAPKLNGLGPTRVR
ncbi:MAG: hypothetical protein EBU81_09560 [Proteobacteria bacterium]|nr:hypothetical protein [Pseudomonadota bacterium]